MKAIRSYQNLISLNTLCFLVLISGAGLKANCQEVNLKEYCIVGYYGKSALDNFKLPFIITFGENSSVEKMESDGHTHAGKFNVLNGNIRIDYGGDQTEDFKMNGLNLLPKLSRTFAMLQKIPYSNAFKGNRYTGILFKQRSTAAVKTTYHFIADKYGVAEEEHSETPFNDYTIIGNLAGYRREGIKSRRSFSFFVLYGTQLLVINNFKDPYEGSTYGTLAQVALK